MNTIGPSLLLIKHPHIICDMPPSCRFPMTFLGRYFSTFPTFPMCLQTQTVLVSLSFLTADSSDHATFFHISTVQCRCSNAHFKRSSAFSSVNFARLAARHFRTLFSANQR